MLELAERAAQRQLRARLAEELANQEAAWEAIDKEDARAADVVYRPLKLERFRPTSIHRGARPSIIRFPADHYPALTVMADTVRPHPESAVHDSRNVLRDALWVEVIVKSDRYRFEEPDQAMAAEGIVNARCKRTGEAVVQAILREPTLGRTVEPVEPEPMLTIGETFEIDASQPDAAGLRLIFQMVRIDLTLKVYTALPDQIEPVPDPMLAGVGA
jgi:hypothetical protein